MQSHRNMWFRCCIAVLFLCSLAGCQESMMFRDGQFLTVGGEFASAITIDPALQHIKTITFQRKSRKHVHAELFAEVEGATAKRLLIVQEERVSPEDASEFFLPIGDIVPLGNALFTADELCIGTGADTTLAVLPEDSEEYSKAVQGMGIHFPKEALTRRWYRIAQDKKSQLVIMYAEQLEVLGKTCMEFNARSRDTAKSWKGILQQMDSRGRASFSVY